MNKGPFRGPAIASNKIKPLAYLTNGIFSIIMIMIYHYREYDFVFCDLHLPLFVF